MALGAEQRANRIAKRRLAGMAHMQWPRGVGRHKFDEHTATALGLLAKAHALGQHLGNHRLPRGILQAQVHEARAGNLNRLDPLLHSRLCIEQVNQLRGQFTGVLFECARQLHGHRDSQVAMAGLLGRLKSSGRRVLGAELLKRAA